MLFIFLVRSIHKIFNSWSGKDYEKPCKYDQKSSNNQGAAAGGVASGSRTAFTQHFDFCVCLLGAGGWDGWWWWWLNNTCISGSGQGRKPTILPADNHRIKCGQVRSLILKICGGKFRATQVSGERIKSILQISSRRIMGFAPRF